MTKGLLLLNNYERNNLTDGVFNRSRKMSIAVRFDNSFWNVSDEEHSREKS